MRKRIEGYDFELYKEYDKANLTKISYKGKVRWFEARVNLVLINPLSVLSNDKYRQEIQNQGGDILLSFGTLVCNGIEALGGFLKGKASYKSFRDFVITYMDHRWQLQRPDGIPYWKALRDDFRNGLAHGFTIDKGGFEASVNYFEMKPYGLEIDEKLFYKDFKRGYEKYIDDLVNSMPISSLYRRFEKRFNEVFINERPIAPKPSIWQRLQQFLKL